MPSSRWKDCREEWPGRLEAIAARIQPGEHVLDVGAGRMGLAKLLPAGCRYTPLDCCATSPETLVADLDKGGPDILLWTYDVAVMCGVLEYLRDPIGRLWDAGRWARRVVCTYATAEDEPDMERRRRSGWVNSLSGLELVAAGAVLVAHWHDQTIFEYRL